MKQIFKTTIQLSLGSALIAVLLLFTAITTQAHDGNLVSTHDVDFSNQGISARQTKIKQSVALPVGTCFATLDEITVYSSSTASAVQTAVDAATPGDTLKIAGSCAGVQLTANLSQTVYISKNLTIQGGYTSTNWTTSDPDTNPTTLDAQSLGRGVVITESANVALENLIVTGGSAEVAAGIYVDTAASLRLINSVVVSNSATGVGFTDGSGGLGNLGQTVISGTTFSYNSAIASAGGVGNGPSGVLIVESSSFSFNTAIFGGGVMNDGLANLSGSTFSGNTSTGTNPMTDGGGGVYVSASGVATLTGNTFTGNNALTLAGGVANLGQMFITDTIFISNSATVAGAVGNGPDAIMAIEKSSFSLNSAGLDAAAVGNTGWITITTSSFISNAANNNGTVANSADYNGFAGQGIMTILNSTILSNTAGGRGGAIDNDDGGELHITGTLIAGNIAAADGGGITQSAGSGSSLHIANSTLSNNIAGLDGGALNLTKGMATISGSVVSYNEAGTSYEGGGIQNGVPLTITNSSLSYNQASYGGAINNGQILNLSGVTIHHNSVDNLGGGIRNLAETTIHNSTISGNIANQGGGLYNNEFAVISLTHSTVTSNSAVMGAGALITDSATMQTAATILSGNSGANDCDSESATLQSNGYNLLGSGCSFGSGTDISTTTLALAPLANNDGATLTHLPLTGSPAIDAIPIGSCIINVDQRGISRPQGEACDIGAIEVSSGIIYYLPIVVQD